MRRVGMPVMTALVLCGCSAPPSGNYKPAETYHVREVHRSPRSGTRIVEITRPDGSRETVRIIGDGPISPD